MASKFWGGDSSDSGSDSGSESSSSSSNGSGSSSSGSSSSGSSSSSESDAGPSKYLQAGSSDSSSDEGVRVVRSAKDKRFIEARAIADEMRNKIKNNDWISLQTLFDKLNKQLERVMRLQNEVGGDVPKFYYRALATLEDAIEATFANKPAIKKMSSTDEDESEPESDSDSDADDDDDEKENKQSA